MCRRWCKLFHWNIIEWPRSGEDMPDYGPEVDVYKSFTSSLIAMCRLYETPTKNNRWNGYISISTHVFGYRKLRKTIIRWIIWSNTNFYEKFQPKATKQVAMCLLPTQQKNRWWRPETRFEQSQKLLSRQWSHKHAIISSHVLYPKLPLSHKESWNNSVSFAN